MCLLFLSGLLFAEEKPQTTLAPELEAKLTEFLKKAREAKRAIWEAQTKKRIDDVTKAAGLEPARAQSLEAPARQAMELSLDEWVVKAGEGWRKWMQDMPAREPEVFDQMLAQVDQAAQSDWFGDYLRPFEQPKWAEGLRAALTADQMAAWDRVEKERRAEVQKELAGSFRATVERRKTQLKTGFETKAAMIANTLSLSVDRTKELTALATTIADAAAEKWRARAERALLWMEDDARRVAVKGGNFYIRPDEKETAASDAAWEAGVAKILTPDEAKRLRTTQTEDLEQRAMALAHILVAQLDEFVAFTTSQRERLRPLVEREVRTATSLLPDTDGGYYQISLPTLFARARGVKAEELQPILDATQQQQWTEVSSGKAPVAAARGFAFRAAAPAASPALPARPGEPEDVEHVISDHLADQAKAERKRLLAVHVLKAQDAARVAGLTEPAIGHLLTAARGSAEEELATWKSTTEQSVRAQVRDATLANVKQRLAGIDRFFSTRRGSANQESGSYWDAAVKSELTDAQRAAWQKELDARAAFRDKAIAGLIVAEFDRRVALTTEQWGPLAGRVEAMVKQYAPDIASMFSYSSGYTWYLASHSMFLPIAAVPEKELKTLLSKEQWDRWSGSSEFGNVSNYWENVQRTHANRVREKKP